jgi:ketopantoate reductase
MQKKLTSSAESLSLDQRSAEAKLLKCLVQEAYFPTVRLLNRVMKRIIISRPIKSLMTQWMENVKCMLDTGVRPDTESIESLLEISKMFSQAN